MLPKNACGHDDYVDLKSIYETSREGRLFASHYLFKQSINFQR